MRRQNTAALPGGHTTVGAQVTKLKQRFGLTHVAVVGDRGMLTKARIKDDLRPAELDWITALRGPAIRALISQGAIQPTLSGETDMAEITSPDYPGERLIACCNPFLAAERARKRGELLAATEAELKKIDAATRRARRPLRGKDNIALAVGKVINKKKVAKHFITEITDEGLAWRRDEQKIADEAALDGIYVVRTSLPAGKAIRPSPVAPAQRSPSALAKPATKATPGGGPVHSFATLLDDLATIAASRIQPAGGLAAFTVITTPTPVQRQAFEFLGVSHRLGYA